MKWKTIFVCLASGLYLVSPHVVSETPKNWTVGELFKRVQYEQLLPVVEFCTSAQPSSRSYYNKVYQGFIEKVNIAVQPIAQQFGSDWQKSISAEEAEKTLAVMTNFTRSTLPQIEQLGAENYCPNFAAKLDSTTAKDLSATMSAAYKEYQARQQGK